MKVKGVQSIIQCRTNALFLAFALSFSALFGAWIVDASLAVAQTNRPTTTSSSTTTSTLAPTTTTTPEVVVQQVANSSTSGPLFSTGRRIFLTVTLLIALGIGLIVLTVLYWRHTRPGGPDQKKSEPTNGGDDAPKAEKATIGPLDPLLADALKSDSAP